VPRKGGARAERSAARQPRRPTPWVITFDLFQVKTPAESKGAWDYYNKLEHITAEEAAPPEADCPRQ
jgi:hypothetical protein